MKDPVDIDLNNHLDHQEKVEAAYNSDYFKQCQADKVEETIESIIDEGIDCLVNWDVLEDNTLAELFKTAMNNNQPLDWVKFGYRINQVIKDAAKEHVNDMDYEEVTGDSI